MPDMPAAQRRRRLSPACSATLASVLLISGLAGCDPADPAPPPSPPPVSSPTPAASTPAPTPTPTPTPTPSPSPTSQKEKEEAAIKQAVLDYNDVLAKVSLDPEADINEFKTVATGELLEVSLGEYRKWRAKGWRATKAVTVENLRVHTISTKEDPPTATATYCGNATGVDVVDRDGKSLVGKDRKTQFPTVVELIKTADQGWLPWRESTRGDACDGE